MCKVVFNILSASILVSPLLTFSMNERKKPKRSKSLCLSSSKKTYECSFEGCGKVFFEDKSFSDHINTHSEKKSEQKAGKKLQKISRRTRRRSIRYKDINRPFSLDEELKNKILMLAHYNHQKSKISPRESNEALRVFDLNRTSVALEERKKRLQEHGLVDGKKEVTLVEEKTPVETIGSNRMNQLLILWKKKEGSHSIENNPLSILSPELIRLHRKRKGSEALSSPRSSPCNTPEIRSRKIH